MASKKLKKAIMAGIVGAVGAKALGQAKEMKTYLAEEGGDKAKRNYITKKAKSKDFMGKVKDAVGVYKKKGLNTGPGVNATSKMGGTLADKVLSRQDTGMEMFSGARAGKMIKARGGKMVNLKPTKLY